MHHPFGFPMRFGNIYYQYTFDSYGHLDAIWFPFNLLWLNFFGSKTNVKGARKQYLGVIILLVNI